MKVDPRSGIPAGFDWTALLSHLESIQPFIYVHNVGNAGDALIFKGMSALFRRHGLVYEAKFDGRIPPGSRIVFSGGGNFVPGYSTCRYLIERNWDRFESFTLLPHTVDGNEDLLARMDRRFTLFCRDSTSHAHCLRQASGGASVRLSHDLAFALGPSDLRTAESRWLYPGVGPERQWRWWRKMRKVARYVDAGGTEFFRTDKERSSAGGDEAGIDISLLLSAVQRKAAQPLAIADTLLSFLARVEAIRTDRLHVAIAGALLGKPTTLYPGSYFKNRAVFEHSMRSRFSKVTFREHGHAQGPFANQEGSTG